MSDGNILVSYPRSGNHLVRFFIELLTERPTSGEIPLYMNIYPKEIPFNIKKASNDFIYQKCHDNLPKTEKNVILLIRNPREVLLRHQMFKIKKQNYQKYFHIIKQYHQCTGKKIIFFYEDMLTNKKQFINKLYEFLECKKEKKLKYVLSNLDELWNLSLQGTGRSWGGNKSKQNLNYYYKQTKKYNKTHFDNYLREKLKDPDFKFLIDKYGNI